MIRILANEQLAVIASYLPSTSRASFAVALSATSSSSGELSGVFGDELDFTNIPELSDDVLRGVLLSIDAKNELKTLRLEGCSQIIGHGLEPLRESTMLERLDLPRLGHVLSIDIVIPLIVSMRNQCMKLLRNLRFPEEWASRDARNDQAFREELERINQILPGEEDRICFQCYNFCDDGDDWAAQCNNCGMTLCDGGSGSCGDFKWCERCGSCYCSVCAQLDDVDAAVCCGGDHCHDYCSACAAESCVECDDCVKSHGPKLFAKIKEKSAEIIALTNESEEKAAEIVALTNENEKLRKEIEELRKRKRDD